MKKLIIAAAVLLLVCASAFAVYQEQRIVDYGGLNIGVSYVYDTYEQGDKQVVDKAGQLGIGFSDFTFFGDTNLGIYLEAGIIFTLKDSTSSDIQEETKSPLYANVALGLGFKRDINKSTFILGAVGLDFIYFTRENTYYVWGGHYVVDRTYITMGAFADLEIAYKLGRDVYFSLGAKGSANFAKWMTLEESAYVGWHEEHSSETQDTEGYFGYRITPRVSVYMVF
ncbi:MAG: hypothetical protein IK091_06250 [Spirochaetales bacterium]|nr:hypothetical protein [Spirochaetales bacterium]